MFCFKPKSIRESKEQHIDLPILGSTRAVWPMDTTTTITFIIIITLIIMCATPMGQQRALGGPREIPGGGSRPFQEPSAVVLAPTVTAANGEKTDNIF
jgi:hypothetical protein